jgi:hypothetical protein
MSKYYYNRKENITFDEVVAIIDFICEYASFDTINGLPPAGAERHFDEVPEVKEPEPTIWERWRKLLS